MADFRYFFCKKQPKLTAFYLQGWNTSSIIQEHVLYYKGKNFYLVITVSNFERASLCLR